MSYFGLGTIGSEHFAWPDDTQHVHRSSELRWRQSCLRNLASQNSHFIRGTSSEECRRISTENEGVAASDAIVVQTARSYQSVGEVVGKRAAVGVPNVLPDCALF